MRKIIVDCDPGMDDSSAIIMAVKNPNLDIQAVTTVNGNYPVDITYRNARRIMRMLGREDIPVYRGCSRPLVRDIPNDPFTHGRDGQGESFLPGFGAAGEPDPRRQCDYRPHPSAAGRNYTGLSGTNDQYRYGTSPCPGHQG